MLKIFEKSSAADLATALEKARMELTGAEAAAETAEAAYQAGLVTETPAALRKLVDAKAEAGIAADIARARIGKLETDLVDAQEAEAENDRRAAYDKAAELTAAAQKRLADYDRAARKIREVLAAIAEADVAVMVANADLPEGAARLSSAESVRGTPNQYREEISNEIVELWAGENSPSTPIEPHLQHRVSEQARIRRVGSRYDDQPEHAEVTGQGTVRTDSGGVLNVVRRRFIKRTFLPDQSGRHIANLAAVVNLPPLYAGGGAYWEADNSRPDDILARLAKPIAARPVEPERRIETEYQLMRTI